MFSREELLTIVTRKTYPPSKARPAYLGRMLPWLERKEVIIIKGVRRCGKTHLMYQLIERLPKGNVFYVNFDDFRFNDYLSTDLLDAIVGLRDPEERAYFFFDEIQRVQGFEKWLRTYYDREEPIKFIIGGSSIALLGREAATVLTGRNITFTVYPLSYGEWKTFSDAPFDIYLRFGGFPEVALEHDETRKRELLAQYVSDIIAKDLLARISIDNQRQLRSLVQFLLAHPGARLSANKLGKQIGTSKDTAQRYLEAIRDTFLVFEVPHYDISAKTKYVPARSPKYYAIDNGLLLVSGKKENRGALTENLVALHLHMSGKEPTYWNGQGEVDFITNDLAIQVTATDTVPERETKALAEIRGVHKNLRPLLVTPSGKQGIALEQFLSDPHV